MDILDEIQRELDRVGSGYELEKVVQCSERTPEGWREVDCRDIVALSRGTPGEMPDFSEVYETKTLFEALCECRTAAEVEEVVERGGLAL